MAELVPSKHMTTGSIPASRSIPFLAFAVASIYVPDISGAATTPKWALLSIFVPILWPRGIPLTWGHLTVLALLFWAAVSVLWSPEELHSVPALWTFVLLAGIFFIGSDMEDIGPVFVGLSLGLSLSSVAAVAQQFFHWHGVFQNSIPAGLFVNRNMMAEAACLTMLGCIVWRKWWCLPLLAPAAFLPMGRGALLGLAIGLLVHLRSRLLWGFGIMGGLSVAILMVAHGYRIDSLTHRLAIWRDTLEGLTIFGNGIGSFYVLYPSHASLTDTLVQRPDHVHNDVLEVLYELGLPGVALCAALWILCSGSRNKGLPVLVGLGCMSFWEFPLYMPVTAFVGALVAGHLCADGDRLRVAIPYRGMAAFQGGLSQAGRGR